MVHLSAAQALDDLSRALADGTMRARDWTVEGPRPTSEGSETLFTAVAAPWLGDVTVRRMRTSSGATIGSDYFYRLTVQSSSDYQRSDDPNGPLAVLVDGVERICSSPAVIVDNDAFAAHVLNILTAKLDAGQLPAKAWTVDGPQRTGQGLEIIYAVTIGATEIALAERWFDPAVRTPVGSRYAMTVARDDVTIAISDASGGQLAEVLGRVRDAHSRRIAGLQQASRGDLAT